MDIHQTEFLQAVVLAGAVALWTTVWDQGKEHVQGAPVGKTEIRKDHARADNPIAAVRNTRVSRDPAARP